MAESPEITVLWQGLICDICKLTVYADSRYPNMLQYTMEDSIDAIKAATAGRNPYIISLKIVRDTGDIVLMSGKQPSKKAIAGIVATIESRYIAISCDLYKREIQNARSHIN